MCFHSFSLSLPLSLSLSLSACLCLMIYFYLSVYVSLSYCLSLSLLFFALSSLYISSFPSSLSVFLPLSLLSLNSSNVYTGQCSYDLSLSLFISLSLSLSLSAAVAFIQASVPTTTAQRYCTSPRTAIGQFAVKSFIPTHTKICQQCLSMIRFIRGRQIAFIIETLIVRRGSGETAGQERGKSGITAGQQRERGTEVTGSATAAA